MVDIHLGYFPYGIPDVHALGLRRGRIRERIIPPAHPLAVLRCSCGNHSVRPGSLLCARLVSSRLCSTSFPIQIYLSWRIRLLSQSLRVFVALVVISAIQASLGIACSIAAFKLPKSVPPFPLTRRRDHADGSAPASAHIPSSYLLSTLGRSPLCWQMGA